MGPLAPDRVPAAPKDVESAEADLRFLHEAVANNAGTVVHGSLTLENLDDSRSEPPLAVSFCVFRSTASATRHQQEQTVRS